MSQSNEPTPPPSAEGSFTAPDGGILSRLMRQILGNGSFADIQLLGLPVEGPAELPVEYGIRLTGGSKGWLNLRTNPAFPRWLRNTHPDPEVRRSTDPDAMKTLTILYGVALVLECGSPILFDFGPILPRPSDPRNWPPRPPDASCALLVDKNPVEIRYWNMGGRDS